MKAIVLAAGRGSRLAPYTDDRPKSLLEIGGRTLIERHLTALRANGCPHVVVVAGHLHDRLERGIRKDFDEAFCTIVVNPDYRRGSGSSLLCAAGDLQGDVLLVEADLLCDEAVIRRLLAPELDNALAIGRFDSGQIEGRVRLRDGHVESLRFAGPDGTAAGDWVGLTRLGPVAAAALRDTALTASPDADGELRYGAWVASLVERFAFRAVWIDDLPWIELDTVADYDRARTRAWGGEPAARPGRRPAGS